MMPSIIWITKERERNLIAACLSTLVIATLCTALVHPKWFHLKGGGCSRSYLGVQQFFYFGYFERIEHRNKHSYTYYGLNEEMRDCVTPEIVSMMRILIGLCFLAMISSLAQFLLDALGSQQKRWLALLRRNAVGSVLSVLFCVTTVGSAYYAASLMQRQQEATRRSNAAHVQVTFDVSYYLVAACGVLATLAAGANLLLPPLPPRPIRNLLRRRREFTHPLLFYEAPMNVDDLPPLPPYTPPDCEIEGITTSVTGVPPPTGATPPPEYNVVDLVSSHNNEHSTGTVVIPPPDYDLELTAPAVTSSHLSANQIVPRV